MSSSHPDVAELWSRIGEVLHYLWDPIGVAGMVAARDEYDMYITLVFGQFQGSQSPALLADLINRIEIERMGLTPNREKALHAASVALDWFTRLGVASPARVGA